MRPYQPVTPANNKYLAKRWDQEIFNTHRKKVAAAKAVIDNTPPTVHMHLHIKLKKLQFEAERLATIERDNRILLEKMAHIMRTDGLFDYKKHDYAHKSLNKTKRQRELLRITHENLAILKRLTTKDPHYNHKKWLLEWQVNQQYLINISKYPHPWRREQRPYILMIQRQCEANKWINKKVHSGSQTVTKSRTKSSKATGDQLLLTTTLSPASKVTEPESTPDRSPAPTLPASPKIKTDSDQQVDPVSNAPTPDMTVELDSTDNAKRLPLEGTSRSSSPIDVALTEATAENMEPIPITISESDYKQAVSVDLPSIETPSPNPNC